MNQKNIPNEIGSKFKTNQGFEVTIIGYKGWGKERPIIQFEDGTTRDVNIGSLRVGEVSKPGYKKSIYLGNWIVTVDGFRAKVVQSLGNDKLIIQYEDGSQQETTATKIRNNKVERNYVDKTSRNMVAKKVKEKAREKHLGTKYITKQGYEVTVVEYIDNSNVWIEFEDGSRKKVYMDNLKRGLVGKDDHFATQALGQVFTDIHGYKATVVKYVRAKEVYVQFECGRLGMFDYGNLKKGAFENPWHPTIAGVGYFGFGEYKKASTKVDRNAYRRWTNMIKRCYDERELKKRPSYEKVTVCEEWHNFQNFAKWYEDNYYEVEDEQMDLDKDILLKGNTVYSPETCCFVPHNINILMAYRRSNRKNGNPVRVNKKSKNCYQVMCQNPHTRKVEHVGTAKTPEEGFIIYKKAKEQYIREVAEIYKERIPDKIYKAMLSYKIEITD